ncbi:hypothetical protein CVT25_008661 [Psilocybe cyanescens]|uniref:Uncharacterized protein n=1 Tax=Psilocybe cyanescens TaxID=93625 RepID=A0A409XP01_PSICY|nr:hypothetical protein CVT25_008661 [Psilocybe cyanescens]
MSLHTRYLYWKEPTTYRRPMTTILLVQPPENLSTFHEEFTDRRDELYSFREKHRRLDALSAAFSSSLQSSRKYSSNTRLDFRETIGTEKSITNRRHLSLKTAPAKVGEKRQLLPGYFWRLSVKFVEKADSYPSADLVDLSVEHAARLPLIVYIQEKWHINSSIAHVEYFHPAKQMAETWKRFSKSKGNFHIESPAPHALEYAPDVPQENSHEMDMFIDRFDTPHLETY